MYGLTYSDFGTAVDGSWEVLTPGMEPVSPFALTIFDVLRTHCKRKFLNGVTGASAHAHSNNVEYLLKLIFYSGV